MLTGQPERPGLGKPRSSRGPRIGRPRDLDLDPPPGQPLAQVRGILAREVVLSTSLDPFLSLRALASYSGLSVRKLRDLLTDPARPLPFYRIGGKILVRRGDYDTWVAHYRQLGNPDLDRIAAEAVRDLRSGPRTRPPAHKPLDTASRPGV